MIFSKQLREENEILLMRFTLIYSLILQSMFFLRSTLFSNTLFMLYIFFSVPIIRHTYHKSVFFSQLLVLTQPSHRPIYASRQLAFISLDIGPNILLCVYISRPTRCTNSYNVFLFIIKCSACFGLFSPSSGATFWSCVSQLV